MIDTARDTQAFALNSEEQSCSKRLVTYDCAVRLRQLGPYLFAGDNQNCGANSRSPDFIGGADGKRRCEGLSDATNSR